MPDVNLNPYNVNQTGSGIAKRTRLDTAPFTDADDAPVTHAQMREYHKALKEWSDTIQFGRVGFQVAGLDDDVSVPVAVDTVVQFGQVISDSDKFTKFDMNNELLKYFQVPPGQGGMYNVNWQLVVRVLVTGNEHYTPTQLSPFTFEVPDNVTELTIDAVGAQGGLGHGNGGRGARTQGKISCSPGDMFDVYVGTNNLAGSAYPDGGLGTQVGAGKGANGGGSTRLNISGDPFIDALLCAGGGGGGADGPGPFPPPFPTGMGNGGDAQSPDGDDGEPSGDLYAPSAGLGATQSVAGGKGTNNGSSGLDGTDGTQTQGGNGGPGNTGTGHGGGGGGGGYFSGGGGAAIGGNIGAGGGAGSSFIDPSVTDASITGAYGMSGDGYLDISWSGEIVLAPDTVSAQVLHVPRQPPSGAPYSQTYLISRDIGYAPLHGAVSYPLQEGDRIYVTITNSGVPEGEVTYQGISSRLSAIRDGF